jgi:hypothetical protein
MILFDKDPFVEICNDGRTPVEVAGQILKCLDLQTG